MLVSRFPYQKLSRKSENGQRLYSCPDGSKLPSVTTILDKTKTQEKKVALENWRKRVGHERAASITREASQRGTRMHTFLEYYMHHNEINESGTNPFSIESHRMATHVVNNGLKDVSEFYGCEVSLYYPQLYAGATDTVFLENGKLVLGDFKQSNKLKKREWIEDYFLQLSGYIIAHDNLYNTSISKGKIMMCTPDLIYQEWVIEDEQLEKYKELWWQRLEKFYKNKFGV